MKGECDEAQRFWCNVEILYLLQIYNKIYNNIYLLRDLISLLYLLQIYNNIYLVRDFDKSFIFITDIIRYMSLEI